MVDMLAEDAAERQRERGQRGGSHTHTIRSD
jgi:hypothetical protein